MKFKDSMDVELRNGRMERCLRKWGVPDERKEGHKATDIGACAHS